LFEQLNRKSFGSTFQSVGASHVRISKRQAKLYAPSTDFTGKTKPLFHSFLWENQLFSDWLWHPSFVG